MSQSISASTEEQTTNAKQVSTAIEESTKSRRAPRLRGGDVRFHRAPFHHGAGAGETIVLQFKVRDRGNGHGEVASAGGNDRAKLPDSRAS